MAVGIYVRIHIVLYCIDTRIVGTWSSYCFSYSFETRYVGRVTFMLDVLEIALPLTDFQWRDFVNTGMSLRIL
jgi:hypothetical protein